MQAEQAQHQHHHRDEVKDKGEDADHHDEHLQPFDAHDEKALLEAVGEQPRPGGEEEHREDEQRHAEVGVEAEGLAVGEVQGEVDEQRVFVEVVGKRAEKLGDEKRQKAAAKEEHGFPWRAKRAVLSPNAAAGVGFIHCRWRSYIRWHSLTLPCQSCMCSDLSSWLTMVSWTRLFSPPCLRLANSFSS